MYKRIKPYLLLMRPSNSPTILSNVLVSAALAGFFNSSLDFNKTVFLLLSILAGLTAYYFGMVFNDLADVNKDQLSKKNRPLALGLIGSNNAKLFSNFLFVISVLCFIAAFSFIDFKPIDFWIKLILFVFIIFLFFSIALYNLLHNKIKNPQYIMGACRFFLILASYVLFLIFTSKENVSPFKINSLVFIYAFGVYVYTVLLTKIARSSLFSEIKAINPIAHLIAGFCLLDFLFLVYLSELQLALISMAGYFATLLLQPLFRGT